MQEQTGGSNTCEGGRAPGKRVNPGKLRDRYRLGLQPVLSPNIREGSMYSQAHISLFNIYWREWLLVIGEVEKTTLGSKEAFCKQSSQWSSTSK